MDDLTKLYETQISLTEWFENAKHKLSDAHRKEDNEKRERLAILNEVTGLPFDKAVVFKASDLVIQPRYFKEFLKKHGQEKCALRLVPTAATLPKLRMRGFKIKDSLKWFSQQNINPEKYDAHFVPHGDTQLWSTIFVVSKKGIFGEIINGGHYLLTQGFYDKVKPITLRYNFKKWEIEPKNGSALKQLKLITKKLIVKDERVQKVLKEKLNSEFKNDYLLGYFETVTTEEFGLWFIDYNRILGKSYEDYFPIDSHHPAERGVPPRRESRIGHLLGRPGCVGKACGRVKIVPMTGWKGTEVAEGEVLVCEMTIPDFLPLMRKAVAIVTDLGGTLSHAAIVAREFGIPCVVATEKATKVLKNGDLVEVNAELGIVRLL